VLADSTRQHDQLAISTAGIRSEIARQLPLMFAWCCVSSVAAGHGSNIERAMTAAKSVPQATNSMVMLISIDPPREAVAGKGKRRSELLHSARVTTKKAFGSVMQLAAR
jgi:hypothetical protein